MLNGANSLVNLLPESLQCKFPIMHNIKISTAGVCCLLSGLNISKAVSNSKSHQGSPRGQSLVPYINGMPNSLQSQVRLFADDTAVYLTVHEQADSKKLKNDLLGKG